MGIDFIQQSLLVLQLGEENGPFSKLGCAFGQEFALAYAKQTLRLLVNLYEEVFYFELEAECRLLIA